MASVVIKSDHAVRKGAMVQNKERAFYPWRPFLFSKNCTLFYLLLPSSGVYIGNGMSSW